MFCSLLETVSAEKKKGRKMHVSSDISVETAEPRAASSAQGCDSSNTLYGLSTDRRCEILPAELYGGNRDANYFHGTFWRSKSKRIRAEQEDPMQQLLAAKGLLGVGQGRASFSPWMSARGTLHAGVEGSGWCPYPRLHTCACWLQSSCVQVREGSSIQLPRHIQI